DETGVREQVVHTTVLQVGGADGVTVAAGSEDARQQGIEIATRGVGLRFAEDADALEEAIAIELLDLRRGEGARLLVRTGVEAQIPLQALDVLLVRDNRELG